MNLTLSIAFSWEQLIPFAVFVGGGPLWSILFLFLFLVIAPPEKWWSEIVPTSEYGLNLPPATGSKRYVSRSRCKWGLIDENTKDISSQSSSVESFAWWASDRATGFVNLAVVEMMKTGLTSLWSSGRMKGPERHGCTVMLPSFVTASLGISIMIPYSSHDRM